MVGGGRQTGEVDLHRVAPDQLDVARRLGQGLELRPQPLVELDHVQASDPGREPLGQALPRLPNLEHDVVGGEVGLPDDHVEQVRVGEEVLAEAARTTAPVAQRDRSPPEDSRGVLLHGSLELTVRDAADLGEPLGRGHDVARADSAFP